MVAVTDSRFYLRPDGIGLKSTDSIDEQQIGKRIMIDYLK